MGDSCRYWCEVNPGTTGELPRLRSLPSEITSMNRMPLAEGQARCQRGMWRVFGKMRPTACDTGEARPRTSYTQLMECAEIHGILNNVSAPI